MTSKGSCTKHRCEHCEAEEQRKDLIKQSERCETSVNNALLEWIVQLERHGFAPLTRDLNSALGTIRGVVLRLRNQSKLGGK